MTAAADPVTQRPVPAGVLLAAAARKQGKGHQQDKDEGETLLCHGGNLISWHADQ